MLCAQARLLRSIPAVGSVLCADLRDARAATAYAGLNPRHRQSGSSLRGRTCPGKPGNARLRRLLHVPALAALRFNPVLRDHAARLKVRGKTGKIMVAAIMRKLLCLCLGVLPSRQPWNPSGRPAPTPPIASPYMLLFPFPTQDRIYT